MEPLDRDTQPKDFWDELPDSVKLAINLSKEQLDRGEGMSHEEVMSEINERFLKS